MKFESIHLFQDEDKLVPTSNFTLSMVFYVCSILAFVLLTTIYRCEMIENEIGVQNINSVEDCDNLITVNCIDECGQVYGDELTMMHPPMYGVIHTSYGDFNKLTSSGGIESVDYIINNYCRMASSPLGYWSSDHSYNGYYAWVDTTYIHGHFPYPLAFSSQNVCAQECGQFTVGSDFEDNHMGTTMTVTSTDCSCVSLPLCTCSATTVAAAERRVTNSLTCKNYYKNKDSEWVSSHPITQCDGTLKEVEECKDMITWTGTFGGYVSLIYSAVGFLFFIAISKARFTKLEKKVNKNSEDIEAEMTSFNNNPDDGTHFII